MLSYADAMKVDAVQRAGYIIMRLKRLKHGTGERQMADELIKRSAALEALGERPLSWTDSDSELAEARQWEYDYHAVKAVPAVDAVPVVHGHWIQVGVYDSNDNCTFECSCCHTGDTHARSVIVPYCWKCGARMDGKDEA